MNTKKIYITPQMEIIKATLQEKISQFIVTSQSIGEDAGESRKYSDFGDEQNDGNFGGHDSWELWGN